MTLMMVRFTEGSVPVSPVSFTNDDSPTMPNTIRAMMAFSTDS